MGCGNSHHHQVDIFRDFSNPAIDVASGDFAASRIDQIDIASKAAPDRIGEKHVAPLAELGGSPYKSDPAGIEQVVDVAGR